MYLSIGQVAMILKQDQSRFISTKIKIVHIKAALGVWNYCYKSARFIFAGESSIVSNEIAKKILNAVENKKDGLTRTELSKLFQYNLRKEKLDPVVHNLLNSGYIKIEERRNENSNKKIQVIKKHY